MKKIALALLLALAACGGPDQPGLAVVNAVPADAKDAPAWAADPQLERNIRAIVAVAIRVWGGKPEALDSWTVVVMQDVFKTGALGTTVFWNGGDVRRTIYLSTNFPRAYYGHAPVSCLALSGLAHEIEHALLAESGDGKMDFSHSDPRWHSVAFCREMAAALIPVADMDDPACAPLLIGQCTMGFDGLPPPVTINNDAKGS